MGHKFDTALSLNSAGPRRSLYCGSPLGGREEEGQEAAVVLLDFVGDFLELLWDRGNFLLHHLVELKYLVMEGDRFLLYVKVYYSFFKN